MKLTLRKVLYLVAGLIGIAGLFLFLAAPLQTAPIDTGIGIKFDPVQLPYQDIFFDTEVSKGAIGGFIGFILLGVGGIVAILNAFVGKKKATAANKLLAIIAILLFIVGAILIFCTKTMYMAQFQDAAGHVGKAFDLSVGTIVGGILGLAAALVNVVALFIKK